MSTNLHRLEKNAEAYFQSGFNCAESILRTTLEAFADDESKEIARFASAFGGGIGGTHEGLCGALAGGIIAISYLMGRTEPGENIDAAKAAAAAYKFNFETLYGTSNCGELLDKFEPQQDSEKCQELVGRMAGVLAHLLRENGFEIAR